MPSGLFSKTFCPRAKAGITYPKYPANIAKNMIKSPIGNPMIETNSAITIIGINIMLIIPISMFLAKPVLYETTISDNLSLLILKRIKPTSIIVSE